MKQENVENVINEQLEKLGYDVTGSQTADFVDGWVRGFEYNSEKLKSANETITLLENRLKGFKLHYAIDEINEENKQLKSDIAKVEYEYENIQDANLKWQNKCAELEEENEKLKK